MLKNTQKIIIRDNNYADGLSLILDSKFTVMINCDLEIMVLLNKTAGHHTKKIFYPQIHRM